jgi:ribosomal protein S2
MKQITTSSLPLNLKIKNNYIFTSKFILQYGVQLGGHLSLMQPEASSIVFGVKTKNSIINLNLTSSELIKAFNIVKFLGFQRSVIYFINSMISFRLCCKYTFDAFNKHLFFPIQINIDHVFRKFKLLLFNKDDLKKLRRIFRKKQKFLIQSGKNLLRKIFVSSKWSYGFVSNSKTFYNFTNNVLHENIKFGKKLEPFFDKIEELVDFYPFLPHYGVIGDHFTNYWIVNEFRMARVPNSSIIDTFTTKGLLSMYGIPGNACSVDTNLFFLILTISYYLVGYYLKIYKFCFKSIIPENSQKKKNLFLKKNKKIFFKKMKFFFKN